MEVTIPVDLTVDEKDMPATENAITELFEGIDAVYFMESGFKAISNELEKMVGAELEIDLLERERFKLKRQMHVVTKKITSTIAKNSLEFNKNVENYQTIRKDAEELLQLIRNLRMSVDGARRKYKASAAVLVSEFKKSFALRIKEELFRIEMMRSIEFKMRELIQGGDILGFVQNIVEAISAMKAFLKYSSVVQISAKLMQILRAEEEKIDVLLAAQITFFMPARYAFINAAYKMIGNFERMSSKLQELFKLAFYESARSVLIEIVQMRDEEMVENLQALPYEQLNKLISHEYYLRAMVDVGTGLVNLLVNYHAFLQFHKEEDEKQLICCSKSDEIVLRDEEESISDMLETQLIIEKGIVQKSLLDNMHSIFKEAAFLYDSLLRNFDLTLLKFDHFLKIIEISERFRKFGHRHFGNACAEISRTLEHQSNAFFRKYHLERVDELKMFLENEMFTLCPVSIQFTLFDLPEFYFLKRADAFENFEQLLEVSIGTNPHNDKPLNFYLIGNNLNVTDIFPTVAQLEDSPSHNPKFQSSTSCDTPDEDESHINSFPAKSMPNLCNTALNLLRIIGRYVRISRILPCTAEQTIDAIIQLYNNFFFTIYKFFCSDNDDSTEQTFGTFASLRLRQFIESISKLYLSNQLPSEQGNPTDMNHDSSSSALPNVCHIKLDDEATLFSLAERIIGIESTIFLSKQMELLRPVLESLIPAKKRSQKLDYFYKTLPIVSDLLEASFGCIAVKMLPYSSILQQIQSIEWNNSEIPSQHSPYVDVIIKRFEDFKNNFDKLHVYVHVSEELYALVWSMLSLCTMRILVQGYSEAKKCSIEGRALQLLDVEQLCNNLEELIRIRPLPHRNYVENYVKAFYLPSDELNQWIVHHTEYSLNQTSALLNAVSSSSQGTSAKKQAVTMSRLMMNLLDAGGMGDNNPLFK